MNPEPGSIEHLSQLISHVVAPAFLLSAVGGFISLLNSRLNGVIQRLGELRKQEQSDSKVNVAELLRLRGRAKLLNIAILLAVISGIVAVVLIIGTFAAALRGVHHVWTAAALFILAGLFLLCSLVAFGVDVKRALAGHDLH